VPDLESSVPLVLLVDDFDDALDMYTEYFTYYGFRVVTARDGAQAMTVAQQHRPDIILMDIRMPVMDGTDAMRALRRDSSFDRVPILAVTSLAFDEERALALRAGFDDVVAKPCLPDELLGYLRRWLTTPRQAPHASTASSVEQISS
jgi:two-component system, cell cycle response regulator DivK